MVTVTVGAGGPDIEPGAYNVVLESVEPKTIVPTQGRDAGKEVPVYEWTFLTDDGEEIQGVTSVNSGTRSKMYAWITALLGKAPETGQVIDTSTLVGRMVIAQIEKSESGWPKLANLSAIPAKRSRPVPVAVADADEGQPF